MSYSYEYSINRSSAADVETHLTTCDELFSPLLSTRVVIAEYAIKLTQASIRLECWSGSILVGLIALYLTKDSSQSAFITNVSVIARVQGKGIADHLLVNSLEYMREHCLSNVSLEVSQYSDKAIALYKKHGFSLIKSESGTSLMYLSLQPRK